MGHEIKPCKCGYDGALAGIRNNGFLALNCPECRHRAEAFTMEGLAAAWNASLEQPAKDYLVECDACPTSGGCVNTCMKAPAKEQGQ